MTERKSPSSERQLATRTAGQLALSSKVNTLPQYLTVKEVADSLHLDPETVRRIFKDKPGVVKLTKGKRLRGKREYVTLRIPADVYAAYLIEMTR